MDRAVWGVDSEVPENFSRAYERRLLHLCASRTLDAQRWEKLGPRFFMAGIAVMLASTREFDRQSLLALAQDLYEGASKPVVFARWLKVSPLRPSRFLPMLKVQMDSEVLSLRKPRR